MSENNFDTIGNQPTIPGEPGGHILSGRYKIVRELGSGGMGVVYLARDLELEMDVAIKVLPAILARNKRAIENLRREARTTLKLTHPNIVRLYHFQSEEEIKYIVMEYVDGGNLEEKISAAGALTLDETVKIFSQVAAGLDYAHSQNVLHRDIKPANIMLSKDGKAKLADFGIARQLKDSMTRITGKETSGTLLYMAPEQFRGGEPDHRSDIYSLAASIYECLSGKPPFWRGSIEYQVMHEEPARLEKLNEKQNSVLLNALAKKPVTRQSCARDLLGELDGSDKTSQQTLDLNLEKEKSEAQTNIKLKDAINLYNNCKFGIAKNLFLELADKGDAIAKMYVADFYQNGSCFFPYDPPKAGEIALEVIEQVKMLANSGNLDAMFLLGSAYQDGLGINKDYHRAIEWYNKAIEVGDSSAMNNLGCMYHDGEGVEQDYQKAIELYNKAIEGGSSIAIWNLGLLYEYGEGVKKDEHKATELYLRAARLGNITAQEELTNKGLKW
ncbi:MAG: protein kinase [Sedimentisphaerales bacterium]|nr:protein kinase [Sedimentisphaerales bacterium]